MVQGFYEERDLLREGQEFLGYNTITTAACPPVYDRDMYDVLYPTLIGAALFQQHREREGGAAHDPVEADKHASTFRVSSFYSRLNASDTNNNYMAFVQNEIASRILPTSVHGCERHAGAGGIPEINDNPAAAGFGTPLTARSKTSIDRPGEGS